MNRVCRPVLAAVLVLCQVLVVWGATPAESAPLAAPVASYAGQVYRLSMAMAPTPISSPTRSPAAARVDTAALAGPTPQPRATPDWSRMAGLLTNASPGTEAQRLAGGASGSTLFRSLQSGATKVFILNTRTCTFDSAHGNVLYEGTHMNKPTADVQSNILGELAAMYFRVVNHGLTVDVTLGGGPARVQLRSDGAVAFAWLGQSSIGSKQISALVVQDRMALDYQSSLTTVMNGTRGGLDLTGRLVCDMTWLSDADQPPLPPYNVQIQATAQRCLNVTWQANTSTGIKPAKYVIVRELSSDAGFREVATAASTYYQDCSSAAINETMFAWYYVIAVSRSNRRSSPSTPNNIQLIDRMLSGWGN